MKSLIAALCAVLLLVPAVAVPATFVTLFPASGNFATVIVTSGSLDGVTHGLMGIDLQTLDLYLVYMTSTGAPAFATVGLPYVYGKIIAVTPIGPSTYRVSWSISASVGGTSASFTPIGTVTVDIGV